MLGTIMVANVFFVIIPAHWELIRAKQAGREPDPAAGARGKQRSVHNNYLTLPVLFAMLSNHFAFTYTHDGQLARARVADGRSERGSAISSTCATRAGTSGRSPSWPRSRSRGSPSGSGRRRRRPPGRRCRSRRSAASSTSAARSATRCTRRSPASRRRRRGSRSTRPSRSPRRPSAIEQQAVVLKAMPLGNVTHMTQAERDALGAWISQGANIP